MGIFDIFKKKKDPFAIRKEIVEFTFDAVKNDKGVRVEDAICLISTIVAERCIDLSGIYNMYEHEYTPGERIFSDQINQILCGNISTDDWSEIPSTSVFGIIYENLYQRVPSNKFPSIEKIFQDFAGGIGKESDWGNVPYTIPEENIPFLLPLRVGVESREQVDKILNQIELDKNQKLTIVTKSLCDILNKTKHIIDSAISIKLSLEIVNGMSKTATLTLNHLMNMAKEMDDEQ